MLLRTLGGLGAFSSFLCGIGFGVLWFGLYVVPWVWDFVGFTSDGFDFGCFEFSLGFVILLTGMGLCF